MIQYLPLVQILVAVILMVLVLLQQRGTGLGSLFGGGGDGGFYGTLRGIQKKIFYATIACGALFIVLALLNLFLQ